jgi:hypothetical protein
MDGFVGAVEWISANNSYISKCETVSFLLELAFPIDMADIENADQKDPNSAYANFTEKLIIGFATELQIDPSRVIIVNVAAGTIVVRIAVRPNLASTDSREEFAVMNRLINAMSSALPPTFGLGVQVIGFVLWNGTNSAEPATAWKTVNTTQLAAVHISGNQEKEFLEEPISNSGSSVGVIIGLISAVLTGAGLGFVLWKHRQSQHPKISPVKNQWSNTKAYLQHELDDEDDDGSEELALESVDAEQVLGKKKRVILRTASNRVKAVGKVKMSAGSVRCVALCHCCESVAKTVCINMPLLSQRGHTTTS